MSQPVFSSIAVQFRFPDVSSIPPVMRRLQKEPKKVSCNPPSGDLVLEQIEGVSLDLLHTDLACSGYALVNASCEVRKNSHGPGSHAVTRFIFSATQQPAEELRPYKKLLTLELSTICAEALWRAHAYSNPLDDGHRGLNIVLNARKPFLQGDGQPVKVWLKDDAGKCIGDEPIALLPSYYLRVVDHAVSLLPA